MKTAVNPPICSPEWDLGSLKYGLAHIAKSSPVYLERLSNTDEYLILDNSADELGEGMGGSDYWDLVTEIQPDEIILPDVLQDSDETRKRGKAFLEQYVEFYEVHPKYSVMGVAQGTNWDDWFNCYNDWLTDPRVDVIGVPYDIEFSTALSEPSGEYTKTERRAINRTLLLSKLERQGLLLKPIHLLGMNNLDELRAHAENNHPMIRSNDTTAPFAAALSDREWVDGDSGEKDWAPLDFECKRSSFQQAYESVEYNLIAYFMSCGDIEAMQNLINFLRED